MEIFDKLFGKNDGVAKSQREEQSINSRYTLEMLTAAYNKMQWRKVKDEDVGMIPFPDRVNGEDYAELYFHLPKENADALILDLFTVLYLIDDFVDNGSETCDISYFDVVENKVTIGFVDTEFGSDFDAVAYRKNEQWYWDGYGIRKYNTPLLINPPPGSDDEKRTCLMKAEDILRQIQNILYYRKTEISRKLYYQEAGFQEIKRIRDLINECLAGNRSFAEMPEMLGKLLKNLCLPTDRADIRKRVDRFSRLLHFLEM